MFEREVRPGGYKTVFFFFFFFFLVLNSAENEICPVNKPEITDHHENYIILTPLNPTFI